MRGETDTISQIATPQGAGGIGIVRVSGADALGTAQAVFRPARGGALGEIAPYTARYGHIVAADGTVIDECVLLCMRAPHSYTGEDTVELQCHGGPIVLREVLLRTWAAGARPAEAGEFTKRAFLNGRLDLARAEGVMELIAAKSVRAARAARERMAGALSAEIAGIRARLLSAIAHIEAGIDFPEDVPEADTAALAAEIAAASADVARLCAGADAGRILREGMKTVIVGRPNVGKSSLLNALLGMERAIVTDVPGTTRDVIEEQIAVEGIPLRLLDTAGLRAAEDAVERIGVARTEQQLADAELVLAVFDGAMPLTDEDRALIERLKGCDAEIIVLCNKEDRAPVLAAADFASLAAPVLSISARAGTGLDALRRAIAEIVRRMEGDLGDGALPNVEREIEALGRAAAHLAAAEETLAAEMGTDFVSIDLRAAYEILGEILGETVDADLIDRIFSEFCIGK